MNEQWLPSASDQEAHAEHYLRCDGCRALEAENARLKKELLAERVTSAQLRAVKHSPAYCVVCAHLLPEPTPEDAGEVDRLRLENARLREENERLKASVAYWQGIHGPRHEGFKPTFEQDEAS